MIKENLVQFVSGICHHYHSSQLYHVEMTQVITSSLYQLRRPQRQAVITYESKETFLHFSPSEEKLKSQREVAGTHRYRQLSVRPSHFDHRTEALTDRQIL